jgi:Tfp pilus assembly protein PilE
MNTSAGFSTIELIALFLLLGFLAVVGYDRYDAVQSVHRDQARKVAINSIHQNLEEVVKPKLGGYPRIIAASQLTAMDKSLLTDPHGKVLGKNTSDYRYEPTGCNGGDICRSYKLSADLEKEADYVKSK